MATLYYLAYGSNLHPLRLSERIPTSRLMGTVELSGYRLMFHKLSPDQSGKCNMLHTGHEEDRVHGALYRMAAREKTDLDRYEDDCNGYSAESIELNWRGTSYDCFTYIAQPSHIDDNLQPYDWYRSLVVLGTQHLTLPRNYIDALNRVRAQEDPDPARGAMHEELLDRLRKATLITHNSKKID